MKKRILSMVLSLCIVLAACPVTIMAANTSAFSDISSNDYYADAVEWAVEKEITNGTSTTTFSPNNGCTRAQVVTFLWRYAGSPSVSSSSKFDDVKPGQYYSDAVSWAVTKGITNGTSATAFSPDDTCTRGQIVTFLWRYAGKPTGGDSGAFADVPAGEYYADAVSWAVSKSITNGTGVTSFAPSDTCTRGQIVTFLWRYSGAGSLPADSINLNHSYTTQFGKVHALTYPAFTFNYPNGWNVTEETVDTYTEIVTLTNDRGATIWYTYLYASQDPGHGHLFLCQEKVTKVADSMFVPGYVQAFDYAYLGTFMVAKIQTIGRLNMYTDTEYAEVNENPYYAVLPASQAGTHSDIEPSARNMHWSFNYASHVCFCANPPEGGFTEQEEKEVVAVLSSFRIAS